MLRTFIFFVVLSTTISVAYSQGQTEFTDQSTRDRINYTGITTSPTGALFTIKGPDKKLIGDPYLDTTWQAGNVKFYNRLGTSLTTDSLAGVPVRLDLAANEVEIKAGPSEIKAARSTAIRYVDVNNRSSSVSRYINVREYQGEAEKLTGFFEQIFIGKFDLLYYPSVSVMKANYNVAMNVGSKDDELVKKFDWYVARTKQAIKLSPSKKAILELMTDKKEQIEAFLKSEKPDLKSKQGLRAVFSYYNKL